MTKPEVLETLREIKEYMDDRADISIQDPNNGNREMRFSTFLQLYIEALEEKKDPEIRIRFMPKDVDEAFVGTLIEETKYSYIVIPDDNLTGTAIWRKQCCEIIN